MTSVEHDLVISLIATLVGILSYLAVRSDSWIRKVILNFHLNPVIWSSYLGRLTGFAGLGIFPLMVMILLGHGSSHLYGLLDLGSSNTWVLAAAITIPIIIVNYFNSQTVRNLARYPEIRISQWSTKLIFGSASSWIVYLIGYEYLFRGILLFSSLQFLQPFTAITLNIAIYTLFHLQKDLKEILGSIPFGILLCLVTLEGHSIWPAVFLHVVLAISNEWMSIYFSSHILKKSSS